MKKPPEVLLVSFGDGQTQGIVRYIREDDATKNVNWVKDQRDNRAELTKGES